jgi:cupin fold WbuC family metalloprotein
MNIYSAVTGELLHVINRCRDIEFKRNDISPNEQYLQVSVFKMHAEQTFRPHMHIPLERKTTITQESWVVIKGKVNALLYDIDKTLLETVLLEQGDCSITFKGGHNYECVEEGSIVYEYKTGPYFGQQLDKVFID